MSIITRYNDIASTYLIRDYDLAIPKTPATFNPNAADMRRIMHLINCLVNEEANITILSSYIINGFFWRNKKVKSASAQSRNKRIKEVILVLDVRTRNFAFWRCLNGYIRTMVLLRRDYLLTRSLSMSRSTPNLKLDSIRFRSSPCALLNSPMRRKSCLCERAQYVEMTSSTHVGG